MSRSTRRCVTGRQIGRQLPLPGASWHNRLDYTPSLVNLYDGTPAEGNDESSLATPIGRSYGF